MLDQISAYTDYNRKEAKPFSLRQRFFSVFEMIPGAVQKTHSVPFLDVMLLCIPVLRCLYV
jgi:hypothetical protein